MKIIDGATGRITKTAEQENKTVFSAPIPTHVDDLNRDAHTDVPISEAVQRSTTWGGQAYHPRYNNTRWMRRF